MQENNLTIKKFIPGIAWFFVVLTLICLPGYDLPRAQDWMHRIYFDKWIHSGIFGLQAYLFMSPIGRTGSLSKKEKWHYFIRIGLAGCLWGVTTELIQKYFIPGRSYEVLDWSADSLGTIIAVIFCKNKFLK